MTRRRTLTLLAATCAALLAAVAVATYPAIGGVAYRLDMALESAAYVLASGAAVLRVGLPLFAPRQQPLVLAAAAAAWSAAFAIVLCVLAPWLLQPRRDGRDG